MSPRDLEKAALRGEPSYVWRAGQERRLRMIISATGERLKGQVLENGCGVGMYLQHLAPYCGSIIGLEYDLERARTAHHDSAVINAACEHLPFRSGSFDAILSHEVLEHVEDDRLSVEEMVRLLKSGGIITLFVPNLGYPYETHGIYWRGHYHFGNIPLIHYLPSRWRHRLSPHVRAYSTNNVRKLFSGLPVKVLKQTQIFGAYDNIINRYPTFGRFLRSILQWLENSPLRIFGLSHFWVIEKE
ncbi:MAG TPA: class I SAM-dependent methyltransferase [Anaerolineales bacterium]|nr:class I SAM-dependent methyltransferase [Anaerolineales bacterium]